MPIFSQPGVGASWGANGSFCGLVLNLRNVSKDSIICLISAEKLGQNTDSPALRKQESNPICEEQSLSLILGRRLWDISARCPSKMRPSCTGSSSRTLKNERSSSSSFCLLSGQPWVTADFSFWRVRSAPVSLLISASLASVIGR